MLFSMDFARLFPNAEIEGGRRLPTIADDVVALHYLLYGVYPPESVAAYLSYRPDLLSDEAQQFIVDARAAEAESEQLGSNEDSDERG